MAYNIFSSIYKKFFCLATTKIVRPEGQIQKRRREAHKSQETSRKMMASQLPQILVALIYFIKFGEISRLNVVSITRLVRDFMRLIRFCWPGLSNMLAVSVDIWLMPA